jgi:hypothetical protein
MKDKYVKSVLGIVLTVFSFCLILTNTAFAAERQKHAVLTVYKNNSGTTYNNELDKIVHAELQKRLEGLYIELDGDPYKHLFKKKNMEDVADFDVIDAIKDAGTDYFIYLELYPFQQNENYNLIYYRKSMVATVLLRIMDINNKKTIYQGRFSLKSKDESDAWFIGNKSVAKKALTSAMYKVGEIISAKLPL